MRFRARFLLLFLVTGAGSAAGTIPAGPDIRDTRLLSEPAVSPERVARDPQLERAIQVVMDELKKNPPQAPKRPAFPVKTGAALR